MTRALLVLGFVWLAVPAFAQPQRVPPPATPASPIAIRAGRLVDPDTGTVALVRYSVCDDFGKTVNPLIVRGQVSGGVAQGFGQAVREHTVYDPSSGQLLSGSFMDYALPRADEMPDIEVELLEIPCASNPLGVKGAGEAGAVGSPPAVVNAIIDALSADGLTDIDMPATPERIWRALSHAQMAQAAD